MVLKATNDFFAYENVKGVVIRHAFVIIWSKIRKITDFHPKIIIVYTFLNEKCSWVADPKPFEKINFSVRKNRFSFELIDLNFEEIFKELPGRN
jgi:hypothetical protein